MMSGRPIIHCIALALAFLAPVAAVEATPGVGDVLSGMPFTDENVSAVLDGQVATTGIHPMSDREIAVGVACLLGARAGAEDVESIAASMWASPRRAVTLSGEIASRDVERALAPLRFPAGSEAELARYLDAGPGEVLNLSQAELALYRARGGATADASGVEATLRESLAARYRAYRDGGVTGIAPYSRSFGAVSDPGRELARTLDNAVYLARHMPALHAALERYPLDPVEASTERFFWYVSSLEQRPSVALGHRVSMTGSDMSVLVERLYYVSHTLNSGQLAIALLPTREGRLLVYVSRVWSDKLGGALFASLKKSAAHDYLVQEMSALVEQLRICRASE